MKSIHLLALLLLVVLASAKLGVDFTRQSMQTSTLNCLVSQNVTKGLLQIWDAQGTVNKDFLQDYNYARDAGIQDFDAYITINDAFSPEDICNGVAHALPTSFKGIVWFDVESWPGLWSRKVADRIPYLNDLTKVCQTHGLKPGVYSSAEKWTEVTGSQRLGSPILKALPVWYSTFNGSADFNDFASTGFGTWTAPTMKSFKKAYMCQSVFNLNYYEA